MFESPIFWILSAFLSGSLPLSVWLGRVGLGVDIREIGDGNPGAFNVKRAGGTRWFVLAMLLDGLKGALPVGIALFSIGIEGMWLAAVALAPIFGHAVGMFSGFKGGKALAVTFGIWTGLSLFSIPILMGVLYAFWRTFLKADGWAVIAGQICLLAAVFAINPTAVWFTVWVGSTGIFLWKYREELKTPPRLKRFISTSEVKEN